jgi:hypothetical protein
MRYIYALLIFRSWYLCKTFVTNEKKVSGRLESRYKHVLLNMEHICLYTFHGSEGLCF